MGLQIVTAVASWHKSSSHGLTKPFAARKAPVLFATKSIGIVTGLTRQN